MSLTDRWGVYILPSESGDVITGVNFALEDRVLRSGLTRRLTVAVRYIDDPGYDPEKGGLIARYVPLEEAIAERLRETYRACATTTRTDVAVRYFVYYLNDAPGLSQAVEEVLSQFQEWKVSYSVQDDPEWKVFDTEDLPGRERWQLSMDYRVCLDLRNSGDDLAMKRGVDFQLMFWKRSDRERCVAQLEAMGYRIGRRSFSWRKPRWELHLTRHTAVEHSIIGPLSVELMHFAEAHGGCYDGWGCGVVWAD